RRKNFSDARVKLLSLAFEKTVVSCVSNKSVLKSIAAVVVAKNQFGCLKLFQRHAERPLVELQHSSKNIARETPADAGPHLGDLTHRRRTIEPRHQTVSYRCRNDQFCK